ncbi:hypothetical protein J3F84DRAFT_292468 [Trichoderma pleuroticola]
MMRVSPKCTPADPFTAQSRRPRPQRMYGSLWLVRSFNSARPQTPAAIRVSEKGAAKRRCPCIRQFAVCSQNYESVLLILYCRMLHCTDCQYWLLAADCRPLSLLLLLLLLPLPLPNLLSLQCRLQTPSVSSSFAPAIPRSINKGRQPMQYPSYQLYMISTYSYMHWMRSSTLISAAGGCSMIEGNWPMLQYIRSAFASKLREYMYIDAARSFTEYRYLQKCSVM